MTRITPYIRGLFYLRRKARENGDRAAFLILSGRIKAELGR